MGKHREPRNKQCIYGQLIFEKGAKVIQCEFAFAMNGAGSIRYPHVEMATLHPPLIPCTEMKTMNGGGHRT